MRGPPPPPRGGRRGRGRRSFNMQPMLAALPPPPPRARRGGRRRRTARGSNAGGSPTQIFRGTEYLAEPTTTLATLQFNCASTTHPRLSNTAKCYERYRVRSVVLTYNSTSGTATTGGVTLGIHPGPTNSNVKKAEDILKLDPSRTTPAWKNSTIRLGQNIDAQRWMHVGKTTEEGVAFTCYYIKSGDATGQIKITYDIEFAYPVPF